MPVIVDYFRNPSTGNGISGRTVSLRRHSDGVEIATAVTDANGMFSFDIGYEGPTYYMIDDGSGTYKRHSSKSVGPIGAIWPDALRKALSGMGRGVMDGLAVSADGSAMEVSVAAGTAILKDGVPYYSDVAQTVTIAAADGSNPRIDRVVIRLTRPGQAEEGKVVLTTVTGTPAATPAAPAVTASSSTDDLVLAQVRVDAGATTIASGKVTDERTIAGQEVLTVPLPVTALKDVTATATELNTLDGITATTAELNYTDGVTSAIQTQLDGKAATVHGHAIADVTSLQTTLDAKLAKAGGTMTGQLIANGGAALGGGTVRFGKNIAETTSIYGHFQLAGNGGFTVSAGTAAGTGATASAERGGLNAFEMRIVTGSSGTGTGTLASVTFVSSRPSSDYLVWLQPHSINASDLNLSVTSRSTTGFDIRANVAPGTGETLNIACLVIEVDNIGTWPT